MTDLRGHQWLSKKLTGFEGTEIHHAIDAPFKMEKLKSELGSQFVEQMYRSLKASNSQYQKGHRQAFHTLEEMMGIGYALDGPRGAKIGATHWLADEVPEIKQMLKYLKNIRI